MKTKDKKYYNYLCLCGCEGKIEIKPWHRYVRVPSVIKGHGMRKKKRNVNTDLLYEKIVEENAVESKLCLCSCGKFAKPGFDYIFQHHRRGKGFSKEVLEKIRESSIGRVHSKESREKSRRSQIGKKKPKGFGEKVSKSKRGITKEINPNLAWPEERKKWLSKKLIGRKPSKETIENMRIAAQGKHNGEKHGNWKGGISKEPYSKDWTETLRKSIRQRDSYICQLCGKTQKENRRRLSIHHIDYDKRNCDPENLTTLCINCNFKVNFRREEWTKFFKLKLKLKVS